jgi:hypothetical protein
MAILLIQKRTPETRLFFIFNRHPISQAGRRGFDPHLPLLISMRYTDRFFTAVSFIGAEVELRPISKARLFNVNL